MDIKHQEIDEKAAEKWLKANKKLHDLHRKTYPKEQNWCKVEIINTEANQLQMNELFKKHMAI